MVTLIVPSLDIAPPHIVLVAEGESASAQSNARGHLFERLMARLFEAYGCDPPTSSTLNVRANGYEVDIATRITLSQEAAIAECKAYTAPLPVSSLNAFYGKLWTERLDDPRLHGWFVAIPGLTSDGHQLARKLEKQDKGFRLITAADIYAFARQKQWLSQISLDGGFAVSDEGMYVTPSGVGAIAKQLDPTTRLPVRVLAQATTGTLSDHEKSLLSATDYASDLPVVDVRTAQTPAVAETAVVPAADEVTLVTVVGSSEDFEYQFPAAPEFFIGREVILGRMRALLNDSSPRGRIVVLNAQSGWGKSSLALRIAHQARRAGGFATVFDTRTATTPSYVSNALRKAITDAVASKGLSLPPTASFASVQSCLKTLQAASWSQGVGPLVIFFDQFENVFSDVKLTLAFRDLALSVRDLALPLVIGFSWKTDLVALTENYPYRLRDEIRGAALVVSIEPFNPAEVGVLLGRLAKAAGNPISQDLRQRLREYSQGLPWLLKKLASHILTQLQAGVSEELLLAESLNIERLFEQDLATLGALEIDALKAIARDAPVAVAELVERVSPEVIQSLVDQRLLVRVGEKLDVYWDIFREFLLTGKVAVEDTYILRQRPHSTARVLQEVYRAGGEAAAADVATALSTSLNVVFNASRELRQLGVLAPKSGSLALVEQLRTESPNEALIQMRVARALRRHTVFSAVQEMLGGSPPPVVTIDDLARKLPTVFPAVDAGPTTWKSYAVAFAYWLDYSGLVELLGQVLRTPTGVSRQRLLGGGEQGRQKTFPQTTPDFAMRVLHSKASGKQNEPMTESALQKAVNDLQVLGLLDEAGVLRDQPRASALMDGAQRPHVLLELLNGVPGGANAIELLRSTPRARSEDVGEVLRVAYGLPWVASTTKMAGTKFRSWARAAGLQLMKVHRKKNIAASQSNIEGLG